MNRLHSLLVASIALTGVFALVSASSCSQTKSRAEKPEEKSVAAEPGDQKIYNPTQWLERADRVATELEAKQQPTLGPEIVKTLEQLQRSTVWTDESFRPFGKDAGLHEKFNVALIRIVEGLRRSGARQELVRWLMVPIRVTDSLIVKGVAFIGESPDDDQKAVRLGGLDEVRLGLATSVCAVIFASVLGDDSAREEMLAELVEIGFDNHSREGLQLIEATFDNTETLKMDKAKYASYRDPLSAALAERPPAPLPRKVYEGLQNALTAVIDSRVVSKGGGYSIKIAPSAFVYRFETKDKSGKLSTEHVVEHRLGQVTFSSRCNTSVKVAEVTKRLKAAGLSKRVDIKEAGWMTVTRDDYAARVRVLRLGGKSTCMLLIEGAAEAMPSAERVDAFLGSIKPAP